MAEQIRPNEEFNPDDHNVFINESDGLSNQHPTLLSSYTGNNNNNNTDDGDGTDRADRDSDRDDNNSDPDSFDDLPTSIIVTNIHSDVFVNDELKADMENLFKLFSNAVTFQWLKSFKRLRVNFDSALAAATARIQLHQYQIGKSMITCYFAQPVTPVTNKNLQLPAPFKQFLISPPASPPAGWEPRAENEPLVNHDLLAALANLSPGESHELHPPSTEHPGIIVHTAVLNRKTKSNKSKTINFGNYDDGDDYDDNLDDGDGDDDDENCNNSINTKIRIQQTKCPERTTS